MNNTKYLSKDVLKPENWNKNNIIKVWRNDLKFGNRENNIYIEFKDNRYMYVNILEEDEEKFLIETLFDINVIGTLTYIYINIENQTKYIKNNILQWWKKQLPEKYQFIITKTDEEIIIYTSYNEIKKVLATLNILTKKFFMDWAITQDKKRSMKNTRSKKNKNRKKQKGDN